MQEINFDESVSSVPCLLSYVKHDDYVPNEHDGHVSSIANAKHIFMGS